ncbi:MAG: hypothetical protein ACOCRO_00560 [Halanaerobiales bacterium]
MTILDLLRSDGSIVINKYLARKLGLHETVILSELISRYFYHKNKDELKKGKWFYCTKEKLEKNTSLNRYYQDKAIDNLIQKKLITKQNMGIPAKRYFKINIKQVRNMVTNKSVKDSQPSLRNSNNLDCKGFTNYSTNNNELNDIKNNNKYKGETSFSITDKEKKILNIFEDIKLYPFDLKNDIEHIRELEEEYPDINLLEQAKKWKTYKRDKPLGENSNARLQFRNFVKNASEWSDDNKVADF